VPVEQAASADAKTVEAPVVDALAQGILDRLRSELGANLVEGEVYRNDVVIRVPVTAWVDVATICRRKLDMSYFCFLAGLDWLDSPTQTTRYENIWGSVEEETPAEGDTSTTDTSTTDAPAPDAPAPEASAEAPVMEVAPSGPRTGRAGGDTRFQVFARYFDVKTRRGVVVKADLDDSDPHVPTIYKIYPGAEWHERETWEMYGFWIDDHPNLRHIYLPGGFEGYPLRKDFPLLAREVKPWPGLTNVEPMAGADDAAEE
jgi:NADH-quinone oxidoreductase subunit C